jgi:hypothetical protein
MMILILLNPDNSQPALMHTLKKDLTIVRES